jgi:hypothetical protein
MSAYARSWKARALRKIDRVHEWAAQGLKDGGGFRTRSRRVAFFVTAHLGYHTIGWRRELLKAGAL